MDLDHTQVDLDLALVGGNGCDRPALAMALDQVSDAQVGQDVAVGNQEGIVQAVDQRERPCGAERVFFQAIADAQAELLAVLEKGFEQVGHVPNGQDHFVDAGAFHLAEQYFQDRQVADRHEWFGEDFGVGRQASAFAAGKDNSFHMVYVPGW